MIDGSTLETLRKDNLFYISHIRPEYENFGYECDIARFDEVYHEACALAYVGYINSFISIDDVRYIMAAAAYFNFGIRFIEMVGEKDMSEEEFNADGYNNFLRAAIRLKLPFTNYLRDMRDTDTILSLIDACKNIDIKKSSEAERIMYDAYHCYLLNPLRLMHVEVADTLEAFPPEVWDENTDDDLFVHMAKKVTEALNSRLNEDGPTRAVINLSLSSQMLHPSFGNQMPLVKYELDDVQKIVNIVLKNDLYKQ